MSAPVVVTLSHRLGAVLPAAAVCMLRGGAPVHADTDVPTELAQLCGAPAVGDSVHGLLLTMDPGSGAAARWVAAGATVLKTPEPAGVGLLAFFPLAINIALVGLELLVALLQAYVFAILTCLYLRDALHLH